MKKLVTLFTDSYKELNSVRTITAAGLFATIALVLGMFSINIGNSIRIGFSSVPNGIIACLFGPVVGGIFSGFLDVLKYFIRPTGTFFPGLTMVTILAGVLYGCMYYKKNLTLGRVLAAKFIVMVVCNVLLNTLCLSILYGNAFLVILPARALKNLVMWPIDSILFYTITRALMSMGAFKEFHKGWDKAEKIK